MALGQRAYEALGVNVARNPALDRALVDIVEPFPLIVCPQTSEDLARWRRLMGLTQGQMGKRLGISMRTLQEIEQGKRPLRRRDLLMIRGYHSEVYANCYRARAT